MTPTGELVTIDDRAALRFERRLRSPVDRVWRAVTEPEELGRWFLAPIAWTPALGERFEAFGEPGTVTELEPPRVIAWEWSGQVFRIELVGEGNACVLVFTHVLADRCLGAQYASGWDGYLDRLEALVGGGFLSEQEAHASLWQRHETYAEKFGLDPEPGRRAIGEHHHEPAG